MVSFKAILTLSLIGAAFATPIEQRAAEPVEDSGAVANSPEGSGMDLGGTDPTADAIEERGLLVRIILRQLLNNKQSGLTIISSTSNAITWLSRPPRR
ncbi:major allergen and cytotoxin AspF1 [Trichophyton verrucosum HKI 0517]|uniref:Major allergen and cytotoxin AspF1 n=1 Tax=Trichophyton verrucosum (strain HKI 0517) TaxID=663202 RepID=D4DEV6_TRIVH|nr:major allergen and cytotoxin AspF1 [Trichophyton verrucosum HKI 0517]EFE39614.1 major allergen and cytotoxin AspF1 [Trichophyton verrucosum HKI 0517]